MHTETKLQILRRRYGLLKHHVRDVGASPGFDAALKQTEEEMRALGEEPEQPPASRS